MRATIARFVVLEGFGDDPDGDGPTEVIANTRNPITQRLVERTPVPPFFTAADLRNFKPGIKYTYVVLQTEDGPRMWIGELSHQYTGRGRAAIASGEIYFREIDLESGAKEIVVASFNLQSGSYRHHASRAVHTFDALVASGIRPSRLVEVKVESGLGRTDGGQGNRPIVDLGAYLPIY